MPRLCAAITAREAGCQRAAAGARAPERSAAATAGTPATCAPCTIGPTSVLTDAYPEDEYWDDLLRVTGGKTDEHLARLTIRSTTEALGWMERAACVSSRRSAARSISRAPTRSSSAAARRW